MEVIPVSYKSYASGISDVLNDYDGHYIQWKKSGYKTLQFSEDIKYKHKNGG